LFQGKKVKKSVSFKLEPEIETYDNKPTKKVIRKVKKVVQVRRKSDEKEQSELKIVDIDSAAQKDSAAQRQDIAEKVTSIEFVLNHSSKIFSG